MSLLDGLIVRDALLETVMQQNIFTAIRKDAPNGSTIMGRGTAEDPYGGLDTSPTWFDSLMSDDVKIPQGSVVQLGPGSFQTKGYGTGGWSPKTANRNSMRIVGAGIGRTELKVVSQASPQGYAVGMDMSGGQLEGFELTDLSIDCGYAPSQTFSAAIRVKGKHVFVRRVRAYNFGAPGSATEFGVVVGAGDSSENCIIDHCVVESPASGNAGKPTFFKFENSTAHLFCAIRNCAGRGPSSTIDGKYRAINAGLGIGTVIEGNQIADVEIGIQGNTKTSDLVIWNNYFRNVRRGADYWWSTANPNDVGRIVLIENFIELSTVLSDPIGILISGPSDAYRYYKHLLIRKNLVRDVNDPTTETTGMRGIEIAQAAEAIVEDNVLNNISNTSAAPNAVRFKNCTATKFFNNQNSGGQLLRAVDISGTPKFLYTELEDQVQDVLLPL